MKPARKRLVVVAALRLFRLHMAVCSGEQDFNGVLDVGTVDVKAVFKRIRFSRKFVLIGGGILLIGGASGVAAVVVGKDKLFGPSYASQNGLECNTVQTVNIKKNGTLWVRKFIRTEGGDGSERVKTALRVAKAIYDKQKPDLVQVSVLDARGPQMRSEMRGRAIAAQAIYIADVTKIPEGAAAQTYAAYYYDGSASTDGQFYGLRIDLPVEDAKTVTASLNDFTDCADPVTDAPSDGHGPAKGGHDAPSGGHGATSSSHAADSSHGSGGHDNEAQGSKGKGSGHGSDEHGPVTEPAVTEPVDGKAAEGSHDAPAVSDANAHGAGEDLLTSTPTGESQSIFSFAYLKSLIFGKGATTAVAAEQGQPAVADAPAGHGEAEHKPDEAAKPEH